MQRLISAVTALSVAMYVVPPFTPMAAMAEGTSALQPLGADGQPVAVPKGAFVVDLNGEAVICLPNKQIICPDGAFCVLAKVEAGCLKKAAALKAQEAAKAVPTDQAAADQAAADKAAADKAAADQAAADQAAADQAAADKAAADQAAADQAAADQAAADKAAADKAAADKAAADQAAADKAAADKAAADKAAADQAAADQAAADQAAADKAAADQAAADKAAADKAAADQAAADKAAADQAAATATTAEATSQPTLATAPDGSRVITLNGQEVICLPANKAVTCVADAICVRPKSMANCEVAAQRKLAALASAAAEDQALIATQQAAAAAAAAAAEAAGQPLVDAPKPGAEAVASLDTTLAAPTPDQADAGQVAPPEPPTAAAAAGQADSPDAAPAADAVVAQETVTKADTRASNQEFAAAPAVTADGTKKTGLSTLEKVGLVALGALVVGQMLKGHNEVVSNSGDRVVVKDPQGNYQVYKDDDTLLRQPGANVRTETFKDGSTRTTVTRDDGSKIVTIRDASGRVLRRVAFDARGRQTVLIDDTVPEERVDVTTLPPPAPSETLGVGTDPELAAALAAVEAQKAGRKFSLRQIRMIPEVKALVPALPVANVTFESGSSAIRPDQAEALSALGAAVKRMIARDPNKVFLIEGHTDAVGDAPMNLTLSDRRAESVAKALTEYFGVPPENLVVQGYGESELKVDTQTAERANRRVVVRDVTPLLWQGRN